MKVVHYIWSGNIGGIEKLTIWLAEIQQRRNDLESFILIGSKKGLLLQVLDEKNIKYDFLSLKNGILINPKAWKKLKAVFSSADVIHIHTFNPWVSLAAALSSKKIVYTLHGNFCFGRKMKWSDKLIQAGIRFFLNRYTDIVTFNSAFTKDTALTRYGLKSVKYELVYNGIDFSQIQLAHDSAAIEFKQSNPNKFIIGTISRLAGFKRIDRLIDTFKIFSAGKTDVLLILVGDGVDRSLLEQKVKSEHLESKTRFLGFQINAADWQSLMDVCVFPSKNEPFGLVAIESLYLGKPVIVFRDSGGLIEILRDVSAEDIVETENQAAQRLEHYYQNRNLIHQEEFIRTRKEYALEFSLEKMENKFYSIYKLLNGC
ncbi:MAG: glycosyltransferase family 4 protein [Bacteroidia bacterium]|nr:glycosyltransferase family 4 protein [Bacteroidia bacterium]MCZ2277454.1 glycosyltransferase family 4 protein [Bacteroidia bacterium]